MFVCARHMPVWVWEAGREGGREAGREGGREGGRQGGREGASSAAGNGCWVGSILIERTGKKK